jgi:hypothetical protein
MMNKFYNKPAAILIYIMIAAGLLIFMLVIVRGDFIAQKNGFSRKVIQKTIRVLGKIENKNKFLSIVGYHDNTVYLSTKIPNKLVMANSRLSNQHALSLQSPNSRKLSSRFEPEIDSSGIRLFAGNIPAVYYFKPDGTLFKTINNLPGVFTRSISVNQAAFILRIIQKRNGQFDAVFAKYNSLTKELVYEHGISAWHGDLGFSTDGLLSFDKLTGLVLYVELFSNKITAIDTNLRVIYKSHTIDTISFNQANYNSMKLGGKKEFTNISPKRLVNSESCIDRGRLFVQSNLKADNETDETFSDNAVIDVYTVSDGIYKGSFYVPNDNGKKVLRFRVFQDLLVALYDDHVITYGVYLPKASAR